jgi:hypothetical protein
VATVYLPNFVLPTSATQRLRHLRKEYVRDDLNGHFLPARERLLIENTSLEVSPFQTRLLIWLRDHINSDIPRAWYNLVLGHDLHYSTFANLHYKHFHANEIDPFTGQLGWLENVGLASVGKVTIAFTQYEALNLVTPAAGYGTFHYHEVGTGTTAETEYDTILATSAIPSSLAARVAGTQLNPTPSTYQTVATLTSTAAVTWQEHGIFNAASGPTLLDRSLIVPPPVLSIADYVQFTYTLTKNAEP